MKFKLFKAAHFPLFMNTIIFERGWLKMDSEKGKYDRYVYAKKLYDDCKKHRYYQATLVMIDGSTFDGIIEDVDEDNVTLLVGEDVIDQEMEEQPDKQRQYGGYGPRRRQRRYRRRNLPLANLAQLALLSYIIPPAYPYPYYPY